MTAVERVAAAYRAIAAADRAEVWIHVRDEAAAIADAAAVDARLARGEELAFAGATLAVKDNIDVEGLPTTAGCPAFAYRADTDAPAVARLRAAGAVILGKTNMDQFATGLTGTRSPYGAVRDTRRPELAAGGSSSGSAVAVALGIADLGLATDTAGSGRVPAAFQGIVGVKPTYGLVPTQGIVPACPSLDCVSILARGVGVATGAVAVMSAGNDPAGRGWPLQAPLAATPMPRVAVARSEQLDGLSEDGLRAFAAAVRRLEAIGAEVVEVDLAPYLEAATLLYDGAFVAERYAAVGAFVAANAAQVDTTVAAIVLGAKSIPAYALFADRRRLDSLRIAALRQFDGCDALMLPTAPRQPTLADVAADPIGVGRRLGTYTNFCNLFDMCAVALPAGGADGRHFGVTLLAPAFHDRALYDLAHRFAGEPAVVPVRSGARGPGARGEPPSVELLVVGAHMNGEPLNTELTGRGASMVRAARTAPNYRLYRLATDPPKPGLVRVDPDDGVSIEGELWALPPAGIASLLAALPAPMALGRVQLDDGTESVGFLCEPFAVTGAEEISAFGGWRGYLAAAAAAGAAGGMAEGTAVRAQPTR
jgi:allophanate hydrolase